MSEEFCEIPRNFSKNVKHFKSIFYSFFFGRKRKTCSNFIYFSQQALHMLNIFDSFVNFFKSAKSREAKSKRERFLFEKLFKICADVLIYLKHCIQMFLCDALVMDTLASVEKNEKMKEKDFILQIGPRRTFFGAKLLREQGFKCL